MAKSDQAPSIIPCLVYGDAPAAIEWLREAFGFEAKLVVPGEEEGFIAHAQLVLGGSMVMLGSAGAHAGTAFEQAMRPPSELAGRSSQGSYLVVDDVDAHHERAVAAGAELLLDLKDEDYGGRGYSCRDPQGHVWSFGTYNPWASE